MTDTDRDDLARRAERIAREAAELVEEALRVRDQHAGRVDALTAEVERLERECREVSRLLETKPRDALAHLLARLGGDPAPLVLRGASRQELEADIVALVEHLEDRARRSR